MRNIQKNAEPHSLTEHRHQAHADFDNYTDKDILRQHLVAGIGGAAVADDQHVTGQLSYTFGPD